MAIGDIGYEFLKKNATADARGVNHVKMKDYLAFMEENGLSRTVLDAKDAADRELINGLYRYNGEQLQEAIKKAKEEGRDPSKEKVITTVNILKGNMQMSCSAAKVHPVPNRKGETVTKFMVTQLHIEQTRQLDRETMVAYEDKVKECLGL